MKRIYNFLFICCTLLFLASCQEDSESLSSNGTGYLRLTVQGSNETTTKAADLPEGYTGEQLAVKIVNESGETVDSVDDWTKWEGEQKALPAGNYTIIASSYGFDGKASALAAPYYYGSEKVTITNGKSANVTVVCSLANVKMSVKIADDIKQNFQGFSVSAAAKDGTSCDPISFNIDLSAATVADTAYFPVTDLVVSYSATNKSGTLHSATRELADVAARDHYILNFTLEDKGQGDVTVEVEETMHTYTYTFVVSQQATNNATLSANAWAKFAYLSASNVTAASGAALNNLKLQYRQQGTETWTDLETTSTGEGESTTYTATATSLTASTTYEYRLAGDNEFATPSQQFTTDVATELYNGNFDNWYQNGSTWYAGVSGTSFWDSSNPGTTTGAGAAVGINPTTGVTDPVHTAGTNAHAACLRSQHVSINILITTIEKFAAASLYVGAFDGLEGTNGARINFGQPFTARPTSLHGFFQYAPAKVGSKDVGNSGVLKEGDDDVCSIFIILSKGTYQVNNTDVSTLLTEAKVKDSDQFIAYGELPADQCVTTNGQWKEFNIPLKYKNLTEKPTHLIIVCTASKYGDYFTGGDGSTLYVDDFSLVYDGEPEIWVKE